MDKYDFSGWATRNNLKCSDGRFVKIEWRFLYRRFQAVKPFLLFGIISIMIRLMFSDMRC